MKLLLMCISALWLGCNAMEQVQELQILPFDINHPDEFDYEVMASKRSDYLEQSYKQQCKVKISFPSKSIQLDDDVLHALIDKEMSIGLGILAARIRYQQKQKQFADVAQRDDQQLFSIDERQHMIHDCPEVSPFTHESYKMITKDYQNALYRRLMKVYCSMRGRPYLLYAMYLWVKEHKKIQYEHSLMFQSVLKVWSGNYHQLKKDDQCVLL